MINPCILQDHAGSVDLSPPKSDAAHAGLEAKLDDTERGKLAWWEATASIRELGRVLKLSIALRSLSMENVPVASLAKLKQALEVAGGLSPVAHFRQAPGLHAPNKHA
jgi:hypothetical protein